MTTKRWIAVVAIVLVGASAIVWRMTRSGKRDADAAARSPSPFADQADAALVEACTKLTESTPQTIGVNLQSARKIIGTAIVRQPWIRDQFAWFDRHKLEGVLVACGIQDEQARALLTTLVQSGRMQHLIQDERRELCRFGRELAESGSAWTEDQRIAWDSACVRMLSGPSSGTAVPVLAPPVAGVPPPAAPAPASAAPSTGCSQELGSQRAAMVGGSLSSDAWIAYGRTLSSCGPETNPWDALHLSGGREQFVNDYVVPFLNGDAQRGSPFQQQAGDLYDRITAAWELGG